jgi:hypothetical protein
VTHQLGDGHCRAYVTHHLGVVITQAAPVTSIRPARQQLSTVELRKNYGVRRPSSTRDLVLGSELTNSGTEVAAGKSRQGSRGREVAAGKSRQGSRGREVAAGKSRQGSRGREVAAANSRRSRAPVSSRALQEVPRALPLFLQPERVDPAQDVRAIDAFTAHAQDPGDIANLALRGTLLGPFELRNDGILG